MDIAMNRVSTLDSDRAINNDRRFRLIAIGTEVPQNGALSILPEAVQRQLKSIRTDLDTFSELEIRCLVMHGYCVSRAAWENLLVEAESRADDLHSRVCNKVLQIPRYDEETSIPWDPFGNSTTGRKPTPLNDESGTFLSASAVPQLQNSQKLRSRFFAARDWVTYLNLLCFVLLTVAGYKILSVVFHRDSPDYLARTYTETIELVAPSSPVARGSMTRTVVASFIKLKNDDAMLERGAATTGDRIEAECYSHPRAEFRESLVTFPGVMKHEYILRVPLTYDASFTAQNVSYQFRFINNLSASSDWVYFIPAFPIERCVIVLKFPVSKQCKHLTLSKIAESGVKKTLLYDSSDPTKRMVAFDWDPASGRFVWTTSNLKPEATGYRFDFDW
jgi:hypothetical protein